MERLTQYAILISFRELMTVCCPFISLVLNLFILFDTDSARGLISGCYINTL